MLNMCSKQDFIPITKLVAVVPIVGVVRNLFQSRQFNVVQILNDCMCAT